MPFPNYHLIRFPGHKEPIPAVLELLQSNIWRPTTLDVFAQPIGGVVDFSSLIPAPEWVELADHDGVFDPERDSPWAWAEDAWSTPGNAFNDRVTSSEGLFAIAFETTGPKPPLPVLQALAKALPDLAFEYFGISGTNAYVATGVGVGGAFTIEVSAPARDARTDRVALLCTGHPIKWAASEGT